MTLPSDEPLMVARVAVDVSLAHLDRPFDYEVPVALRDQVVVGCRVKVRFSGRQRDGYVLSLTDHTDADRLQPLLKVVTSEPLLSPTVAGVIRQVADHCGGTFADVLRLAVPPRHAATEKAEPKQRRIVPPVLPAEPFAHYPTGAAMLAALTNGQSPRAAWQVVPSAEPVGDWALGFATAAAATVQGGRGALLIVPDQRDLDRLATACTSVLGPEAYVTLTAEVGPAARYRAFLAVSRGQVAVAIGTRAAAFAPVHDLGLVALWDDGDDLLSEPRAPYPHVRDVLAIRGHAERAAVLMAGYARSVETQAWVEQGWLRDLSATRPVLRRAGPGVKVATDTDTALSRDPAARAARLPHDVFTVLRAGLAAGPVLVQVPRAGYLAGLVCQTCREPVRCPHCHGPVRVQRGSAGSTGRPSVDCGWCGRLVVDWTCPHCDGRHWRAPVVGSGRTAEELGKAFPHTPVIQSWGGRVVDEVGAEPALVVSTPGAEPRAATGYATAVLLDAGLLLTRSDLRAEEEALRRWLNAAALVRGGADGGTVIVVGPTDARAVQALVRLDPAGFAQRELADRTEAHFPPSVRYLTVEGSSDAVAEIVELVRLPAETELLGPVEVPVPPTRPGEPPGELSRLILRGPLAYGSALTRAVADAVGVRSARKRPGAVRVRVDPPVIG